MAQLNATLWHSSHKSFNQAFRSTHNAQPLIVEGKKLDIGVFSIDAK
jgi:hypothetical protein